MIIFKVNTISYIVFYPMTIREKNAEVVTIFNKPTIAPQKALIYMLISG